MPRSLPLLTDEILLENTPLQVPLYLELDRIMMTTMMMIKSKGTRSRRARYQGRVKHDRDTNNDFCSFSFYFYVCLTYFSIVVCLHLISKNIIITSHAGPAPAAAGVLPPSSAAAFVTAVAADVVVVVDEEEEEALLLPGMYVPSGTCNKFVLAEAAQSTRARPSSSPAAACWIFSIASVAVLIAASPKMRYLAAASKLPL